MTLKYNYNMLHEFLLSDYMKVLYYAFNDWGMNFGPKTATFNSVLLIFLFFQIGLTLPSEKISED